MPQDQPRGARRPRAWAVTAAAVVLLLTGCTTLNRLPAEPPAQAPPQAASTIAGCSTASPETGVGGGPAAAGHCRFLVLRDTDVYADEALASVAREQAWAASHGQAVAPTVNILAISGGGDDGAFGAGLLVGWTEAGSRPEFKAVTGVSTGALTAPFAFLGSRYDDDLKAVYTQVSQKDIFKKRNLLNGVFGESMADTSPLYRLVERYVDRTLLDAIAAEYAKGRLLLVGTTDLDSREPVIWNMTAIAASKDPQSLVLFRKVLLASAAIPGAFPPVLIDVVGANGKHYQEMHVDGGAMAQVFAYPPTLKVGEMAAAGLQRPVKLYVIRNARLDPDWASVERRTLPIATRAISTLMQAQGVGDLYRIYHLAERDRIDFNLAYIPRSFSAPHKEQFDPAYMQALFKTGQDMALASYPWEKVPPGYVEPVHATPQ
jgi:hypothetical protein